MFLKACRMYYGTLLLCGNLPFLVWKGDFMLSLFIRFLK